MEQDVECLVVFAVHIIIPDELEELPHLVFRDGFPRNGVIHHHSGKFKAERVLDEDIIVHRHLECRTEDTTHGLDGTVPSAILLQFDEKQLCIGGLDHTDLFLSERLIQQNVPNEIVVHLRTRLHTSLSGKVPVYQLDDRQILACGVKLVVEVVSDLLLQFPEGKAGLFALGQLVGRFKPPTVHKLWFSVYIIFELVFAVCPEGFSPAENTVLCITPPGRSSCTCHSSTPPSHVDDF